MSERFDYKFVRVNQVGVPLIMNDDEPEKIKAFLRKELADQKNRAIDIVEDLASKADQNLESADRYQGMEAAATALKDEL